MTDEIAAKTVAGDDLAAPADKLFCPGWLNLRLRDRTNVPPALRANGRDVGLRCHNLLSIINRFDSDSEIDEILTATRFFCVDGETLTQKGRDFRDSSLDYLIFCCNAIKDHVNAEHITKWREVRNSLFMRLVPEDIQRILDAFGQGFDRWW